MKNIIFTIFVLASFLQLAPAENYSVIYKGQKAGKASLKIEQNQYFYSVTMQLFPVAIAKVFGIDDMTDESKGFINNGHYKPNSYTSRNKKGKTLMHVTFEDTRVKVTDLKGSRQFNIGELAQDPLSQIAQIQYDLKNKTINQSYELVTNKGKKVYHSSVTGWNVSLSAQPHNDKQIHLLFDNDYNLIKMQKIKNGKNEFTLEKE